MGELTLEARDVEDPSRWRWVLTGPSGVFLAGHEVRLDQSDWLYEAAADLAGYLPWHAAPGSADETRIITETGAWLGTQVLGEPITTALAAARPCTVRAILPEELTSWPLELAHAAGRPLSVHGITLITTSVPPSPPASSARREPDPVGGRLRVLGLSSLPEGGQPLSLRRERHLRVLVGRQPADSISSNNLASSEEAGDGVSPEDHQPVQASVERFAACLRQKDAVMACPGHASPHWETRAAFGAYRVGGAP